MSGPCTYAGRDSAEVKRKRIYGIFKREKYSNDISKVYQSNVKI